MAQREWVEKDFYKELGVSSDASAEDVKRAARRLLAENHPDRNPGNKAAEDRYKAVSEAKEVLTDPAKRKEYDETRRAVRRWRVRTALQRRRWLRRRRRQLRSVQHRRRR